MADEFMNNEQTEEIEKVEDAENVQDEEPKREYKALIRCIDDYCKREKKSYRQLSLEINKKESYIGQIMSGTSPSLDVFVDILNVINIAPSYALADQLTIDRTEIISEAISDVAYLKRLGKISEDDLARTLNLLKCLIDILEKK